MVLRMSATEPASRSAMRVTLAGSTTTVEAAAVAGLRRAAGDRRSGGGQR
jgi:hypothetical protein